MSGTLPQVLREDAGKGHEEMGVRRMQGIARGSE